MVIVKIILLSVVILAIAFVGLAFQILFRKDGKFPNTHIGANKYLKSKGVTCFQTYDKIEQSKVRRELRFKELTLDQSDD